jgi:F0F1-type ATP synthase membrane subunit b/b'
MSKAKAAAKKRLGDLDLSYLDKEREVSNNIYNTSKNSLQTNFDNLLNAININRADTTKNFNTGRSAVAENAFTQNRLNNLDVSSRVTGISGLKDIGEVGNRIETGRQYSNLANTFYGDMRKLDTTEKESKGQFGLDNQALSNTLAQAMAGINTRGAEAKNNYNMTLGQLAEAIQGRWDNNANAKAALEQARRAAAQANARAREAANQSLVSTKRQALTDIVNMKISSDDMINRIMSTFGVNSTMATNVLQELGIIPIKNASFDINKPYTSTQYVNQLVGGW